MLTIQFVYADDVQFKATNVVNYEFDDYEIRYHREVFEDTRISREVHAISKEDLLYAKVVNNENGMVSVIPGIYNQFNVNPYGPSFHRHQNIVAEQNRIAENREATKAARDARSHERYLARRAKRKAAWLENNPQDNTETTVDYAVQSQDMVLKEANISEKDYEVLKSMKLVK